MRQPSFRCQRRALLASLLLACTAGGALAQQQTDTLDRLRQTGVLRVGYGINSMPFSYLDADGTVIGYSIDLCKKIADSLRASLGLRRLDVEYVPRSASQRVQMLNDGMVDIDCAASTNTPERRTSASFSISHFYTTTRYVSLAKNQLRKLQDLRGRSVSVTLGTVNVGEITRANREHRLNLSIVMASSLQDAFDLVTRGQVSAFAMDDVLLATMIASSADPSIYAVSDDTLTEPQPYGLMMRLNDRNFENAVNEALRKIYASQEITAIYDRWFNQPIPPKGINLRIPMHPALAKTFETAR